MKINLLLSFIIYVSAMTLTISPKNLFAEGASEADLETLIQEGDLVVTRKEALLMISEMSWAQKQQLVKNQDKFQGLLLNYLTVKKQTEEAKKRQLDKNEIVKWKIEKQNAQLLARELIEDFQKNINVPESIKAIALDYYNANPEKFKIEERVGVSHILLAIKPDASEQESIDALKKAKILISEIKAGLDFYTAAKEHSDDQGSASQGGNINAFPRGQMVPPFEKSAFSLKTIGEISEPIKTRFGYHIIKLTSRIEAGLLPFEEVGPALIKKERDKYLKIKTDEFLSSFNANKNTTIYLPALQLLLKEESSKLVNPLNKSIK